MYFHTESDYLLKVIEDAAIAAQARGTALRLDVDSEGQLRIKIGAGMWSPPFASDPDPYRDQS